MPEALLSTKLYIPPPRPGLVLRPRLVERLDEGLHLVAAGLTNQAIARARALGLL